MKNPRPQLIKKDVVYEVPCLDCEKVYIGETQRNIQIRQKEHKAAVRRDGIAACIYMLGTTTTELIGTEQRP